MSQSQFLNRQILYLRPDPARVVVRPFKPATEPRDLNPTDKIRANHIVDRVLRLDAEAAAQQLSDVLENFEGRHRNLLDIFETRAAEMEEAFEPHAELNKTQRRLIGAYFLHEYSFEASALFNPSIVRHPDQSGAPENGCRFILSLRAVGEGHISSLTFRSGTIAADGSVAVDPTARLASVPKVRSRTSRPNGDDVEVIFRPDEELSERVIFPITDAQSNGIEDARFVEFNDDGRKTFYATYTAYSGRAIRSELLETTDFQIVPDDPARRIGGAQQGHGSVPAKNRWPLCDDRPAGQREPLSDLFRRSLHMGWRSIHPSARVSLGVRSDRQLWLTHRAGRLLAVADTRGWSGQEIFDRGGSPGQEGSLKGSRALARAAGSSRAHRTRRLRAQRRLYLRRNASRRPDHLALCGIRHLLQFRDDKDCGADAGVAS